MAENKVVLITGTRKGIGRALVEHYAGNGCHVVGCSRSPFEGELPNYRHYCLDVGDESAVKRMFSEIRKQEGRLDVLINNAGVIALPDLQRTKEGWEMQFATNHLGHFALALGLHGALAVAGDARIVSLSSVGHQRSPVIFDDLNFTSRPYDVGLAYGQSKTATVLFAVEATRSGHDRGHQPDARPGP